VLFLGSLLDANLRTLIAVLFIAAMVCLTAGLLCLLREVYLSTYYLRIGEPEPEQKPALASASAAPEVSPIQLPPGGPGSR